MFDFDDFLEVLTAIALGLCVIGFDGCWVFFMNYMGWNIFVGLFTGSLLILINVAVIRLVTTIIKDLF